LHVMYSFIYKDNIISFNLGSQHIIEKC